MIKQIKNLIRPFYNAYKKSVGISKLRKGLQNKPLRIVVGASNVFEEGWIPTEESFLNLLKKEDFESFFKSNKIDVILAEHVWEHLTEKDGTLGFKNCFDYLKPGGYLRIAVPDGYSPDMDYINKVKPGGTGLGSDDHKVLYNYQSLSNILKSVGFEVRILECYDEKGQFIYNEWDPKSGMVHRSKRFDERNQAGKLVYTSLILDAVKPL